MKTWRVLGLDVWGHCHDDCHDHGCPCANQSEEEIECECSFWVNDRSRIRTLDLNTSTDEEVVARLKEEDILADHITAKDLELRWSDDFLEIDLATTGRPLLQLEVA